MKVGWRIKTFMISHDNVELSCDSCFHVQHAALNKKLCVCAGVCPVPYKFVLLLSNKTQGDAAAVALPACVCDSPRCVRQVCLLCAATVVSSSLVSPAPHYPHLMYLGLCAPVCVCRPVAFVFFFFVPSENNVCATRSSLWTKSLFGSSYACVCVSNLLTRPALIFFF